MTEAQSDPCERNITILRPKPTTESAQSVLCMQLFQSYNRNPLQKVLNLFPVNEILRYLDQKPRQKGLNLITVTKYDDTKT